MKNSIINSFKQKYQYTFRKRVYPTIETYLNVLSVVAHVASIFMITVSILRFGGVINWSFIDEFKIYETVWWIYLADRGLNYIFKKNEYLKSKYSYIGWSINALLLVHFIPLIFGPFDEGTRHFLTRFNEIILFIVSALDLSYGTIHFLGRKTNPSLVLAVSFLILIFAGSGLLLLPNCRLHHLNWIDSLFTATSAVCVTGLTTIDVSSTFTQLGQLVIMMLIQIGGLGIMTITSFFALFFMGNTSLYNQMVMRDMVSSDSLSSLYSVLKNIFIFTFVIEFAGAALIFFSVPDLQDMGMEDRIFFSVFHSISAFCNAGFSNFSTGLSDFSFLSHHNFFFWILTFLIVFGSIGYPILANLRIIIFRHLQNVWKRMHGHHYVSFSIPHLFDLNTKIVLATTSILIILGAITFGIFEWNNAFGHMDTLTKITQSVFNSVSPRTAGFASVSLTGMCTQSILIYIFLMWIGGASQSTAGGIKVNAFAVAFLNLNAILHGTTRVEVFGRELPVDSVRRANATVFASIGLISVSIFVMSIIQPGISLRDIAFECVSAICTVGSSLDVTARLNDAGKSIIIVLMFIGRVGAITLAQGIFRQYKNKNYHLPTDNIIIS